VSFLNSIVVFSHTQDLLGESPRWHPLENKLYWTDIEARLIHLQPPDKLEAEDMPMDVKVGCIAFRKTGGLILATDHGFQILNTDSHYLEPLVNPEAGKVGARFNDGYVDAAGRFWAGTMTEEGATSSLYRLDPDKTIHTMESDVTISNGIATNKENTRLYFTDTLMHTIWLYDFDLSTGSITNRRTFVKLDGLGLPDGLSVDSQGNVWSVICGKGIIVVFNPDGVILETIAFPTDCITACTFGGPDLGELYVTSSRSLLDPSALPYQPLAGAVFKATTSSHGIPNHLYNG
jgi:sugar lactone lactonase YvrE